MRSEVLDVFPTVSTWIIEEPGFTNYGRRLVKRAPDAKVLEAIDVLSQGLGAFADRLLYFSLSRILREKSRPALEASKQVHSEGFEPPTLGSEDRSESPAEKPQNPGGQIDFEHGIAHCIPLQTSRLSRKKSWYSRS